MTEIYKPVLYKNFGEHYQVSNFGNVKTLNNRILSSNDNNGYLHVCLSKPYNCHMAVHRLVALTFITNHDPEKNTIVNHIDENTHNNHQSNLEWTTQKDNVNKSSKDKTHKKSVIQKDMDDNVICIFATINEAAEKVGVDRTTISKVLVGVNQTAGGYKWEYEDETLKPKENISVENAKDLSFLAENLKNYFVFENGDIYNKSRKMFLKPCMNAKGALYVTLFRGDKKSNFYIQQLVSLCYIPNPNGKKRVRHLDNNKSNNSVENLEWY